MLLTEVHSGDRIPTKKIEIDPKYFGFEGKRGKFGLTVFRPLYPVGHILFLHPYQHHPDRYYAVCGLWAEYTEADVSLVSVNRDSGCFGPLTFGLLPFASISLWQATVANDSRPSIIALFSSAGILATLKQLEGHPDIQSLVEVLRKNRIVLIDPSAARWKDPSRIWIFLQKLLHRRLDVDYDSFPRNIYPPIEPLLEKIISKSPALRRIFKRGQRIAQPPETPEYLSGRPFEAFPKPGEFAPGLTIYTNSYTLNMEAIEEILAGGPLLKITDKNYDEAIAELDRHRQLLKEQLENAQGHTKRKLEKKLEKIDIKDERISYEFHMSCLTNPLTLRSLWALARA